MSETHLLAFHIGPVQDFIATARRTQDWWIGSWLLAHLSQTAIGTARDAGADLVLPKELVAHSDRAIADTPNHFLARVKDGNPADIARQVQIVVDNKWSRIHSKVKREFFGSVPDDVWTRQLESFLEIYWAVVSDDGSTQVRSRAQAALDARKRLRDFIWAEEPHLKCTLCGARQELSGKTSVGEARKWWVDLVNRYLNRPHLEKLRIRENGNERLCAVCAVKRAAVAAAAAQRGRGEEAAVPLAKTDASFPSTSSVAAVTFVKRLLDRGKANGELEAHFKELEGIGIARKVEVDCLPGMTSLSALLPKQVDDKSKIFDGDVFYLETFTEKRIREEYPEADPALAEFGAVSLRGLYHAADAHPSKYLAALMMDGDHMGAFFGNATEEQAGKLSRRMSQFARNEAKEVVAQHFGRLVYAGGDDALALLPLETALDCARKLQEKFTEAVREVLPRDEELPKGAKRPTSSIGIAIAHHTQPLDATLVAMQQAERAAKNIYERDALCVYVLKRSGEEIHVGMHWRPGDVDAVKVVTVLIDLLKMKAFSMRFPTMFGQEAQFLPTGAIDAELRRLGKRQAGEQFDQHKQEVTDWLTQAGRLARAIGAAELAQWTLVARFIASGGRDEE